MGVVWEPFLYPLRVPWAKLDRWRALKSEKYNILYWNKLVILSNIIFLLNYEIFTKFKLRGAKVSRRPQTILVALLRLGLVDLRFKIYQIYVMRRCCRFFCSLILFQSLFSLFFFRISLLFLSERWCRYSPLRTAVLWCIWQLHWCVMTKVSDFLSLLLLLPPRVLKTICRYGTLAWRWSAGSPFVQPVDGEFSTLSVFLFHVYLFLVLALVLVLAYFRSYGLLVSFCTFCT